MKTFVTALFMALIVVGAVTAWTQETPGVQPRSAKPNEEFLSAHCANNLKMLGLVCKMFANESRGAYYPKLSTVPGKLMWDAETIYPEYLTDCQIMLCPASKEAETVGKLAVDQASRLIDDHSYIYLGYAVMNEEQLLGFLEAYTARAGKETFDTNLTLPNGKPLYRLREGIERFLITDANDSEAAMEALAKIPLLIERPGNHSRGANVLYLDGHVEMKKCPGEFPYTNAVLKELEKISALRKTAEK